MSVVAQKYVYSERFKGMPKRSDLKVEKETLRPLKDGEILAKAVWLSVDPYMRLFADSYTIGQTMVGEQVAQIVESKNPGFKEGDYVIASFGWRTHTISNGDQVHKLDRKMFTDQKLSTALGVLGMPGATAYLCFIEVCLPKEGETVVIDGAAGAVGSIVGQIAKIKGCRVVGFAGSDEKVAYLKELGFDEAVNYKKVDSLSGAMQKTCPKGIDIFFDNVGGDFYDTVIPLMNKNGRVAVVGSMSQYNLEKPEKGARLNSVILAKTLKIQGFVCYDHLSRWPQAHAVLNEWIDKGQLKYRETVTDGFDKMFDAFLGLFGGTYFGKAVVKA